MEADGQTLADGISPGDQNRMTGESQKLVLRAAEIEMFDTADAKPFGVETDP